MRLGVRSKLCVVLLTQQVAARSTPDPFGDLGDQPELRGLLLLRQLVPMIDVPNPHCGLSARRSRSM
jgi:hypothetical protein